MKDTFFKHQARQLEKFLAARGVCLPYAQMLEATAAMWAVKDWNALSVEDPVRLLSKRSGRVSGAAETPFELARWLDTVAETPLNNEWCADAPMGCQVWDDPGVLYAQFSQMVLAARTLSSSSATQRQAVSELAARLGAADAGQDALDDLMLDIGEARGAQVATGERDEDAQEEALERWAAWAADINNQGVHAQLSEILSFYGIEEGTRKVLEG